jgi:hypothetical protein
MRESYQDHYAANGARYVVRNGRYAIPCVKCSGSGTYWRHAQSASGPIAVAEICYRCQGESKEPNAKWITEQEVDAHADGRQKAHDKREAKREAEWAAKCAEHEAQAVVDEKPAVEYRHVNAAVGEQIQVAGKVTAAVTVDGFYGPTRLVVVETPEHEIVKTFTSAAWAYGVERDQDIVIAATVKEFGYYQGQPETVVNRPKVV